jgi:hypothetical protein
MLEICKPLLQFISENTDPILMERIYSHFLFSFKIAHAFKNNDKDLAQFFEMTQKITLDRSLLIAANCFSFGNFFDECEECK